jgi:AraC-like DNA-binding protein
MEHVSKYLTKEIKLSSYEDKLFKSDLLFEDHMLIWFISGETKIIQADMTYTFQAGDVFLIPRNHLATVINYPKAGLPHKTVVMHLSADRLKRFYQKAEVSNSMVPEKKIYSFGKHPLLESCLASVLPYFDIRGEFPEDIASLKITEAITIVRKINQDVDNVLANFDVPGKVDLVSFMERNFMFNMPLERFGYLTGRSLSTFNRDFRKIFYKSPQKWLMEKRLELAYYHLANKAKRPSEVYLEAGFEDLSHFSFAFKKKYGVAPAQLKSDK